MNRYFIRILLSLLLVSLTGITRVFSQNEGTAPDLTGVDLGRLLDRYADGILRGDKSLILPYADALFYSGKMNQALHSYRQAHSEGMQMDSRQQRNFTHAAKHFNETSPYDDRSFDYFSGVLDMQARIRPHCVNSDNEDFAPFVWNDLLFITSSRDHLSRRRSQLYRFTKFPFLNVYAFTRDCMPAETDFLPLRLNTRLHDGPIALAPDTSLLVINRTYKKPNRNGVQTMHLTYFVRESGKWSNEKKFPFNDPSWYVQHPFFDDSTKSLYFSSDMPGGFGGFDLYRVTWDGLNWSVPVNLGPDINTRYDEVFPAIAPDGHLVFSSNHIETSGGMDIVMFREGQRFLLPFPLNSSRDDFAITFLTDHSGYFSTNRELEAFGDNIYLFELYRHVEHPFVVRVIDSGSGLQVPGASVSIFSQEPLIDYRDITNNQGEVTIFKGGVEPFTLVLKIMADGYYEYESITDEFKFDGERWILTAALDKVPDEPAIQEAIQSGYFVVYFDNQEPEPLSWQPVTRMTYPETFRNYLNRRPEYDEKSASNPASLNEFFAEVETAMQQLDWLAEFLLREFRFGRNMTIIFTSHASPLGRAEYNMPLSRRRFASVENFFRTWNGGVLNEYIDAGKLQYENTPYGSVRAASEVSDDPEDLASSIYSVEAARERKVTISWRQNPELETGLARSIQDFRTAVDQPVTPQPAKATGQAYHIIVASYSQLQLAEQHAADLRSTYNTPAVVLPRTPEGFYRVSYNRYATRERAVEDLPVVRRILGGNPWIHFE